MMSVRYNNLDLGEGKAIVDESAHRETAEEQPNVGLDNSLEPSLQCPPDSEVPHASTKGYQQVRSPLFAAHLARHTPEPTSWHYVRKMIRSIIWTIVIIGSTILALIISKSIVATSTLLAALIYHCYSEQVYASPFRTEKISDTIEPTESYNRMTGMPQYNIYNTFNAAENIAYFCLCSVDPEARSCFKRTGDIFEDDIGFQHPISTLKTFRSSRPMHATFSKMSVGVTRTDKKLLTSDATRHMVTLCKAFGFEPYFRQMSLSNQAAGYDGDRAYHWESDFEVPEQVSKYESYHLDCFVNVDYHLDMPNILLGINHSALIYTLRPHTLGQTGSDSFRFLAGNVLEYRTAGRTFNHKVWDYGQDFISVRLSDRGFTFTRTFKVSRKVYGHHQLVLLTLISEYFNDPGSPYQHVSFQLLKRLEVDAGNGYNVLIDMSTDQPRVHIARYAEYTTVTMPLKTHEALLSIARNCTVSPIGTSQIMARLGKEQNDDLDANIVTGFYRTEYKFQPRVIPLDKAIRVYDINHDPNVGEVKSKMSAFATPIVPNCYAPAATRSNEEAAVEGRVLAPQLENKHVKMTLKLKDLIHEFAKVLVPRASVLVPVDFDEVWRRQNTPEQRRLVKEADMDVRPRQTESFIKNEPSAKVSDPRVISTIRPRDKIEYSMYTYSVSDWLKSQPWYAFGLSPKQVATRVGEVCSAAEFITNTDFSRFDGHVHANLREMESVLMRRLFPRRYHKEMDQLLKSQQQLPGKLPKGTRYKTGSSRLSGSPETSVFNTISNAFTAYIGFRLAGCTSANALSKLGIYGGDDGLTANLSAFHYLEAAKMVGQKLTIETVMRDQFGVKFLARIYGPDIWSGDINSMCDLRRQLSKFHASANMPPGYTPAMKAVEKASSFLINDPNTPILSDYSRRILTLIGPQKSDALLKKKFQSYTVQLMSENSSVIAECAYPNDCSFFGDYLHEQFPNFDMSAFQAQLLAMTTPSEILRMPIFEEPNQPTFGKMVLVDDRLLYPVKKPDAKMSEIDRRSRYSFPFLFDDDDCLQITCVRTETGYNTTSVPKKLFAIVDEGKYCCAYFDGTSVGNMEDGMYSRDALTEDEIMVDTVYKVGPAISIEQLDIGSDIMSDVVDEHINFHASELVDDFYQPTWAKPRRYVWVPKRK